MKKLGILATIILVIMMLAACNNSEEVFMDSDLYNELSGKILYANDLNFQIRAVIDDEIIDSTILIMNYLSRPSCSLSNMIFIHSEEEAQGFPDDFPEGTIIAWPLDHPWTDGFIAGLHWAVTREASDLISSGLEPVPRRNVITLEQFGFVYPLSRKDLVDNWEMVNLLWNHLDRSEQSFIQRAASVGSPSDEEDASFE